MGRLHAEMLLVSSRVQALLWKNSFIQSFCIHPPTVLLTKRTLKAPKLNLNSESFFMKYLYIKMIKKKKTQNPTDSILKVPLEGFCSASTRQTEFPKPYTETSKLICLPSTWPCFFLLVARKLQIVNTELGDLGMWGRVSYEKQLLFTWPFALLDIFLLKYDLLPSTRENILYHTVHALEKLRWLPEDSTA